MFGCAEHWFGKRFAPGLTSFLTGRDDPAEIGRHERMDRATVERLYGARRDADARAHVHAESDDVLVDGGQASDGGARDYPWHTTTSPVPLGRTHVVESNDETVELGRFDPARPPVATIDSGDVVVYPNTWTHFLNRLQPGVPIEELARMRRAGQGRGVHSIVGPVAVRDARPGDLLEIRFLELRTIDFGANFHNAGALRTGSLPDEFPDGHIHYFDLDAADGYVSFAPHIKLEMRPFQGTFGVAAPGGVAVSSVAPGQHAGNIDVKELTAGSTLYVPVWNDGGLIYTGDSHALQGDGEVNITALETAMEEVRVQVILHKAAGYAWPMIETATHWMMLGMNESLNEALRISLRNTIDFLSRQAQLSRNEAYSLASLAVDFRVSQMVDVQNGIHAMIPKSIFDPEFRKTMRIAD
ncbi:MAG: hypothetical protein NVS3B28_08920 [Candidatus Velthaea sp.]